MHIYNLVILMRGRTLSVWVVWLPDRDKPILVLVTDEANRQAVKDYASCNYLHPSFKSLSSTLNNLRIDL